MSKYSEVGITVPKNRTKSLRLKRVNALNPVFVSPDVRLCYLIFKLRSALDPSQISASVSVLLHFISSFEGYIKE